MQLPIKVLQSSLLNFNYFFQLKKNIELPGIEEIRVGKHKRVHKRENRLFTYGFPQFANGPEYKGVPKIIDLQYMYGGFVSTTGDHDYNVSYQLFTGCFKKQIILFIF